MGIQTLGLIASALLIEFVLEVGLVPVADYIEVRGYGPHIVFEMAAAYSETVPENLLERLTAFLDKRNSRVAPALRFVAYRVEDYGCDHAYISIAQ